MHTDINDVDDTPNLCNYGDKFILVYRKTGGQMNIVEMDKDGNFLDLSPPSYGCPIG